MTTHARRTFALTDFESRPDSPERGALPYVAMSMISNDGYIISIDAPSLPVDEFGARRYVGEVAVMHDDDPDSTLVTLEWSTVEQFVSALATAFGLVGEPCPPHPPTS